MQKKKRSVRIRLVIAVALIHVLTAGIGWSQADAMWKISSGSSKIASHRDTPNNCSAFIWNALSVWDSAWQETYVYTPNGKLAEITREQWLGGTQGFGPQFHETYGYDSHGNIIDHFLQEWRDTAYMDTSHDIWYRDAMGNDTLFFHLQCAGAVNCLPWDTTNGQRHRYTFMPNMDIASVNEANWIPSISGGYWLDADRTIYHYGSTPGYDTVTYYGNNSGIWNPIGRWVDVTWADFANNRVASYVTQLPSGGWSDVRRMHCSYNGLDSDCISEGFSSSWDTIGRDYSFFDADSHLVNQESWVRQNNLWSLQAGTKNLYTLDSALHVTQRISQVWNANLGYRNSYKYVYASYFVGMAEALGSKLELDVFPNPAADRVHFRLGTPQSEAAIVSLFDMYGRLRMEAKVSFRNGEVDLSLPSQLEDGAYLYVVASKAGTARGKILVQR